MALSLLCGGLGVAEASVHVEESGVTYEVYTTGETYSKETANAKLDLKADKTDVATNTANINNLEGKLANLTSTVNGKADEADVNNKLAQKADQTAVTALDGRVGSLETTVGDASSGLVKDVADLKTQGNDLNTAIGNKADQSDLNAAKAKITTNETNIIALQTKTTGLSADGKSLNGMNSVETDALTVKGAISNGAGVTTTLADIDASMKQTDTNKEDIANLQTKTNTQQAWIGKLKDKTTKITYDASNGTSVDGVTFNAGAVTGVTSINGTKIGVPESGEYISQDGSIWGNMKKVDTQVKTNADAIGNNTTAIAELGTKVGTVGTGTYLDPTKSVGDNLGFLDAGLKQEVADRKAAIGELAVNGNYIEKDKNVSDNLVKLDNQAKANAVAITETKQRTAGITRDDIRNETNIEGKVTVDTNGNIKAEGTITSNGLNAGSGEITTAGKVSAGEVSTGTLETTGDAKIGGDLDVKGTLNTKDVTAETIYISKSEDKPDYKSEGSIIGEGGNLSVSNKKTDKITNITEESQLHVNEKGTVNWATSTENATGNVTEGRSEVTADKIKNSVQKTEGGKTFGYDENITADGKVGTATDKDGNRNELTQTATGTENTVTSKDGNKSTTKQEAGSISSTVYDKDGNVKASSEMKEDGSISNNATGDMTNTVGGKLTTTVTGQATENFNGGLNTKVTGAENHTVTGKQTNTVEGGQENIISGGQINNITGDQTTTITGNKKETVTENVTEDYKKNLTTTVGGNEIHDVKGTKTETVERKLTENFKGGQETNVTGDQTTNVSGTQTTTATDINRNASSSMVDKVDNAYGTNTETKEAGKTTTDVSIKGTGEKGKYIRGANESRDYLIKDTLMNSETKTAEATSSEITDGTNTASTRQDAKNLAGSVTNGTETGVSGIHAKDNSVSIDSIVTDGNKYSVINQKKGSIQSTVVDGTNSTVILQDKDNVTIASSNGTVGIGGKDIVNNAQDTITNTAGTKITDTAGDSTVTTEKDKGTTFTKRGSMAYRDGGPTDTNISGNTITTGKVTMDYADVMRDLGVGGNANIAGTTTTKTLNVTEDASVGRDLSVGGNATIAGDVTARSYKVDGKTYIDANGINANNQKITNVADGSISEGSKDAVNGGQLYGVKRDLEHQVDKVGANAAAMANLRPMEFDPSSKWNIAAAIGNYGSETAAAIGAFYRPNDNVMVNLSTAFGTGENMVGGGVSVRLGKGGNKLSREETNALKAQVADLTARMDALLSVLNPNMSKDFPDVPENHWAYEAVSRLAGNDIVQGYPDGEFHGERTMTRYEMAEIIYNALSRGAEAERELVEEFKPELQAMAASEKSTAEKAEG